MGSPEAQLSSPSEKPNTRAQGIYIIFLYSKSLVHKPKLQAQHSRPKMRLSLKLHGEVTRGVPPLVRLVYSQIQIGHRGHLVSK